MQKQARLSFLSYLFLVASFLFWYRANLAFCNGLFLTTTNMQFVFDFFALFPSAPGPSEFRALPQISINKFSLMCLLNALAALGALSALYYSSLGYKVRDEPRWYSIPAVLSITMLFLTARLAYWSYTIYG